MVVVAVVCCGMFFCRRVVVGRVFFCSIMWGSCRASDVIFATSLPYQSALPKRSKTNFILNERRRIQQRCSTQITSNKHDRDFDNILRFNGYPERTIDETKHLQKHQRDPQTQTKEWHYLKIPFISDRLNRKITGIFKRENIPV